MAQLLPGRYEEIVKRKVDKIIERSGYKDGQNSTLVVDAIVTDLECTKEEAGKLLQNSLKSKTTKNQKQLTTEEDPEVCQ